MKILKVAVIELDDIKNNRYKRELYMKLLRTIDGMSYYENPDRELAEKIKNEPRPNKFKHWSNGWSKEIGALPNGKITCESEDGDIFTICVEELKEYYDNTHLENINSKYSPYKIFTDNFLPIEHGNSILQRVADDFKGQLGNWEYVGVNPVMFSEKWSAYNGADGIKLEYMSGGARSGMVYFNEVGELVNRDYNFDFNNTNPFFSKKATISHILSGLNIKGEVLKRGNNWFTDRFSLTFPEITEETSLYIEKRSSTKNKNVYYNPGESHYKIMVGKKAEPKTKEELEVYIKEYMETYFKCKE